MKLLSCIRLRGAIGGKTSKTAVLPGFCKIEHGSGVHLCYRGLIWLWHVCPAVGAPLMRLKSNPILVSNLQFDGSNIYHSFKSLSEIRVHKREYVFINLAVQLSQLPK